MRGRGFVRCSNGAADHVPLAKRTEANTITTTMAIRPYVIVLVKMLRSRDYLLAIDTISSSQPLHDDGRTTLVSKDETFELGFFSP
ncbi:hypothetical protein K1719_038910 [Acacia pycnantha]|nr:hypothetical protein K1719_038910 [Acacia pycnantha]